MILFWLAKRERTQFYFLPFCSIFLEMNEFKLKGMRFLNMLRIECTKKMGAGHNNVPPQDMTKKKNVVKHWNAIIIEERVPRYKCAVWIAGQHFKYIFHVWSFAGMRTHFKFGEKFEYPVHVYVNRSKRMKL